MIAKVPEGTIYNADNDLKRIANFARGIIALDEAVARFGGLESAIAQAEARLADAKAAGEAQEKANAKADADHRAAIATRNAEADLYTQNSRTVGDRLVAEAGEQAKQILNKARADGDQLKRDVEASLGGQRKELRAIGVELQDKQRQIGEAAAKIAKLTAELADKERALEEHKARHRKFLQSVGALPSDGGAAR